MLLSAERIITKARNSQIKDQVVEVLFLDAVVQSDDIRVLQFAADPGLSFQLLEIWKEFKLFITVPFQGLLRPEGGHFIGLLLHENPPAASSMAYPVTLTFWCL